MTVSTLQPNYWQNLPPPIIATFTHFLNAPETLNFSQVDRAARKIFLSPSLMKALLQIQFKCEPSSTIPWPDQYLGLTVARSPNARVFQEDQIEIELGSTSFFDISQNGKQLATNQENILKFWNFQAKPYLLRTIEGTGECDILTISGNGARAITLANECTEIHIWNATTGSLMHTLHDQALLDTYFVLSNDGTVCFAFGDDGIMRVIDVENGKDLQGFEGRKGKIQQGLIDSDNKKAALHYKNNVTDLWDLTTRTPICTIEDEAMTCMQFSADSEWLISKNARGTLKIWDTKTGQCLKTVRAPSQKEPLSLLISQDKTVILTSYKNGTIDLLLMPSQILIPNFTRFPSKCHLNSICLDGTTSVSTFSKNNFHIQQLNLAELPHQRVHRVATAALRDDPDAQRAFQDLPSHVQGAVSKVPPMKRRKTSQTKTNDLSNTSIYEGLSQYSLNTFLPEIIRNLMHADPRAPNDHLTASALARFRFLPEDAKKMIYLRLSVLHKMKGKTFELPPEIYGLLAFHNEDNCYATNEERIAAIQGTFTTTEEAKRALRKNAQGHL